MPALPPSPRAPAPPRPTSRPQKLPGGLVYVTPAMPGLTRVRSGAKAFRYRLPDGQWLQDPDEVARIKRLAIPPAYTDVWICPLPHGHLQATGLDARGRRQYRYHPQWRAQRDESKFEHMQAFGRVRPRHVQLKCSQLKLRFRGKSGVLQEVELDDPRVARVVRRCQQLPGQELFQYEDEDGSLRTVGSGDVNDYLREITHGAADSEGDHFTAKDFRTWHGITQALELTRLACTQSATPTAADKNVRYNAKAILAEVARQLGNTPAVCKKSYVHPAVLELGTRLASDAGPGLQAVWNHIGGTTSPRGLSAAERRLLAFLRKPQKLHKARPTTKA